MSNVYISYSRNDQEFVKSLVKRLEKKKIRVFFDKTDIASGASIADSLINVIRSSEYVLVIMSPDYFDSAWRTKEVEIALAEEFERNITKVIPILLRDCDIPPSLQSKAYADFRKNEEFEQSFQQLVSVLTNPQYPLSQDEEEGSTRAILGSILKMALASDEAQKMMAGIKSNVAAFIQPAVQASPCTPPAIAVDQALCFVVMPFGNEELNVVYEYFVKPELEKCKLKCERGDDVFGSNVIMDDIRRSIEKAGLILADLTGKNANVFYEVGIAHTLDKPVLLLSQSMNDVPFDLRHRRVLLYEYTPKGCKQLEKKIMANVSALLK